MKTSATRRASNRIAILIERHSVQAFDTPTGKIVCDECDYVYRTGGKGFATEGQIARHVAKMLETAGVRMPRIIETAEDLGREGVGTVIETSDGTVLERLFFYDDESEYYLPSWFGHFDDATSYSPRDFEAKGWFPVTVLREAKNA